MRLQSPNISQIKPSQEPLSCWEVFFYFPIRIGSILQQSKSRETSTIERLKTEGNYYYLSFENQINNRENSVNGIEIDEKQKSQDLKDIKQMYTERKRGRTDYMKRKKDRG